jgi:DNA-directed RNA polymerase specialized sigma subunit
MSIDEVKNFLNQAYRIDLRIDTIIDEISALEGKLLKCTQSYNNIQMGGSKSTFEYTLDKVMQYKERLNNELSRLIDTKAKIKTAIEKVENPIARIVLTKKYINYQTFEHIACDLDYSTMQVYRLHKIALENLKNVIEC